VDVPEIDVDTLVELHRQGATVLDVRNPDEYEQAHVPGAILIPLPDVPERVDEVPATGTIYVICAMGGRSRKAAGFLRQQGVDATNVAGGTNAWIDAGFEVRTGAGA
jgi:rhodanese-related sulfurtransferase